MAYIHTFMSFHVRNMPDRNLNRTNMIENIQNTRQLLVNI